MIVTQQHENEARAAADALRVRAVNLARAAENLCQQSRYADVELLKNIVEAHRLVVTAAPLLAKILRLAHGKQAELSASIAKNDDLKRELARLALAEPEDPPK